ncbi:hypothetical protein EVAR_27259_1 [Eumeta japonica]|uniref:Uncharacterized protein n=1 Tax=Eumeta variegata TaxID=151549 RepID=A0A4C1W169_EUMVA|nr:hypothetical protein EVAR_27259_1 [Eumeta japonica]
MLQNCAVANQLRHENVVTQSSRHYALTKRKREVTASAADFVQLYPILTQEAGNALVISLGLRESLDGVDHRLQADGRNYPMK